MNLEVGSRITIVTETHVYSCTVASVRPRANPGSPAQMVTDRHPGIEACPTGCPISESHVHGTTLDPAHCGCADECPACAVVGVVEDGAIQRAL